MDKASIITEIQRTASGNGGKPLGMGRFESQTGIKRHDWYGKYWARWGDALIEAGFEPNSFQSSYNEELVIASMIEMIRHFGKYPTHGEIRIYARKNPEQPSHNVFGKFGGKAGLVAKIVEYCSLHSGNEDIIQICRPIAEQEPIESNSTDVSTREKADYGHVYLMKSGKYYKIGRTNSAGRREYELSIQLPERLETLHVISTDDPPGIEAYWHKRFEEKRLNGEWFDLDPVDLRAFKRRGFM